MIKKITLSILVMVLAVVNSYAQYSATIAVKDAATNPVGGAQVKIGAVTINTNATTGEAVFTNLADGIYNYTVNKVCYVTASGTVVVAGGNVSQTQTIALKTTNDVSAVVSNGDFFGTMLAGFSINLTNGTTYNQTTTSDNLSATFFTGVPYGNYTYTISKDCYITTTGTLTVDCGGGIENQIYVVPVKKTTNDVSVVVSNGDFFGTMLAGFSINLTNGTTYNQTATSDNLSATFFTGVPYGNYTYTISKDCYITATGTLTVNCGGGIENQIYVVPVKKTTNDVSVVVSNGDFFGTMLAGFSINLTNGTTYNQTATSDNLMATFFTGVPYGNYTYTISKDCYITATGTLTVNCGGGIENQIYVVPVKKTTNDVSVVVSNGDFFGTMLAGFSINLTNGTTYNQTATSDNLMATFFTGVPYGNYTYTISKDCYITATGTLTVDCGGGIENQIYVVPVKKTTNDVSVVVSNGDFFGTMLAGFSINLTNGTTYNQTATSDNLMATFFTGVPYGNYTYTISKDCYITATGTLTVDCGGGIENQIYVVPVKKTTNDVSVVVSNGDFFGTMLAGFSINLTNGTTYNQTATSDNLMATFFTGVPYGNYTYTISKDCYITTTGTLTVDCGGGIENQIYVVPVKKTTNDVSVVVSNGDFFGTMLAGFSINLTNGTTYNQTATSDNLMATFFTGVPYGNYTYTISKDCYITATGTLTVDCGGGIENQIYVVPVKKTTNDVSVVVSNGDFFGTMLAGFSINLTNGTTYNQTATSDNLSATFFTGVPYGNYTYTISKDCYITETGTLTVDCGGGIENQIYVVPVAKTTNSVFFFVGNLQEPGCTITLTNGTTYTETLTDVDALGSYEFTNVPFGNYTYTVSKGCFVTSSGSTTVNCNNGDGIGVFVDLVENTTNSVFFFVGNLQEPGCTITLTNGTTYTETLTDVDILGSYEFTNVPFGNYTYTIAKDCFVTSSGSTTVDCNNGDGIGVFEEITPLVIDNTVTQADNVLTANAAGMTYQWVDCDNENTPIVGATGQTYTATANGNYSVIITNGTCPSATSDCIEVSNLGIAKNTVSSFTIYPNPAQNDLSVAFSSNYAKATVEIVNIRGQVVFKNTYAEIKNISLDVSKFSSGVYIIKVIGDNQTSSKRFIKQ